jgi:hypothetical protein
LIFFPKLRPPNTSGIKYIKSGFPFGISVFLCARIECRFQCAAILSSSAWINRVKQNFKHSTCNGFNSSYSLLSLRSLKKTNPPLNSLAS